VSKIVLEGENVMKEKAKTFGFETLENRELMAADIRFDAQSGTLSITGTSAADTVQLNAYTTNTMDIWVNRSYMRLNPNAVRAITMDLGAGNDRVEINGIMKNQLNPNTVDIKLGTGVNESVWIELGSAKRINIDAIASRATNVGINASVTDRIFVDMGSDSDTGADKLRLYSSDINRLEARMGGGNDVIEVLFSTIQTANVSMGAGNDKVVTSGGDGHIGSGTIDGGTGTDTIDPLFKNRGRRFERVWSW